MRVFLFISEDGEGCGLAKRVADEGHRVLVFINNRDARKIGNGIVEKHPETGTLLSRGTLEKLLHPAPDCVVFTSGAFALEAVELRKKGYNVLCGQYASVSYQQTLMRTFGVATGESEGVDVCSTGWFNGTSFTGVVHSLRDVEMCDGGKGPRTSGMGITIFSLGKNKLYLEGLHKLIKPLTKLGYRGPISLEAVVGEGGLVGRSIIFSNIEYMIYPLLEIYKGRANDLLYMCATGILKNMDFRSHISLCVKFKLLYEDQVIGGFDEHNLKHIWLMDVDKQGDTYTGIGYTPFSVTAWGASVDKYSPLRDARCCVVRTIKNLTLGEVIYREDIGVKVYRVHEWLKTNGWINEEERC